MSKELREKPKRLFNVVVIRERQQQGVMAAVAMTTANVYSESLTAVFPLAGSVESVSAIIKLDCCEKLTNRTFPRTKECYEQKRLDCKTHAFR